MVAFNCLFCTLRRLMPRCPASYVWATVGIGCILQSFLIHTCLLFWIGNCPISLVLYSVHAQQSCGIPRTLSHLHAMTARLTATEEFQLPSPTIDNMRLLHNIVGRRDLHMLPRFET